MSRGGRGGYGRGRGGIGGGGKQRIGGQEVSWDYDPDLEVDNKPQELFPKIELPIARPITRIERAQVERYKAFRQSIHDGPLYTILGDEVRIGKVGTRRPKAAQIDPFEDMPSYTHKYKAPQRKLPRFDTRVYDLRFFPKELWDTVDPKFRSHARDTSVRGMANGHAGTARQRRQDRVLGGAGEEEDEDGEDGAAKKAGAAADDEDANIVSGDEEDAASSEKNPEDDFSEDDSDMGGDYNAEGYFDAGEDDFEAGNADGMDDGGMD